MSSPPIKPGVYFNPFRPRQHGGLGDFFIHDGKQMLGDGAGGYIVLEVDMSEERGRSTESLLAKLREIEKLYSIADNLGVIVSADKAREYNAVEEELIRREVPLFRLTLKNKEDIVVT